MTNRDQRLDDADTLVQVANGLNMPLCAAALHRVAAQLRAAVTSDAAIPTDHGMRTGVYRKIEGRTGVGLFYQFLHISRNHTTGVQSVIYMPLRVEPEWAGTVRVCDIPRADFERKFAYVGEGLPEKLPLTDYPEHTADGSLPPMSPAVRKAMDRFRQRCAEVDAAKGTPMPDLLARVQSYLGNGGLFNPEAMDHTKVRDLVMDLAAVVMSPADAPAADVVRDARRYRRLQILGCAPSTSSQLDQGTVLAFTNLDAFVDEDLRVHPSRGEAMSLSSPTANPERVRALARNFAADWLRPLDPDHATPVLVDTLMTTLLAFFAAAHRFGPVESGSFPVYRATEWQCRYVFPDSRCCGLKIGHTGGHVAAGSLPHPGDA